MTRCKPFIKWAGGKSQLLPELIKRVPKFRGRYIEPFLGSAALFLKLSPERAILSDVNQELINVYEQVRDNVECLIEELSNHRHQKSDFYTVRAADRSPAFKRWSAVKRASRFIYLNKTCFNGLYRVNSKGEFNVPFGKYKNPRICDPENLRACSAALEGVAINCSGFVAVEKVAKKGDFVYLDPPYVPLSATSSFTSYAKDGFGEREQRQLRDLCCRLDKKGVLWMVSNSSAKIILDLYKEFRIEFVNASRAINSVGTKRGKVKEVVVRNY